MILNRLYLLLYMAIAGCLSPIARVILFLFATSNFQLRQFHLNFTLSFHISRNLLPLLTEFV